jgi:hypothetical protein
MNYPSGQFTYGRPSTVGVYKSWPWWRLQCIRSLYATCVITILAPLISRWRLDFFLQICAPVLYSVVRQNSSMLVEVWSVWPQFFRPLSSTTNKTSRSWHAHKRTRIAARSVKYFHPVSATNWLHKQILTELPSTNTTVISTVTSVLTSVMHLSVYSLHIATLVRVPALLIRHQLGVLLINLNHTTVVTQLQG